MNPATQELIEARALDLVRLAVKGAPYLTALRDETAGFQALLAEAAREIEIAKRKSEGSVVPFADSRGRSIKSVPSAAS
jgi:hypothetical protein